MHMKHLILFISLCSCLLLAISCSNHKNSEPTAEDRLRDSLRYMDVINAKDLSQKVAMEQRYLDTPLKKVGRNTYRAIHYDEVNDMLSKDAILLAEQEKKDQQDNFQKLGQQKQLNNYYSHLKDLFVGFNFINKEKSEIYTFKQINRNLSGSGIYGICESDNVVRCEFSYIGNQTILIKTYNLETGEKQNHKFELFGDRIVDLTDNSVYWRTTEYYLD